METISSISYNQEEIISNILKLHVPQGFIDCDLTYSKGNFYKSGIIKEPIYKFDKFPQTEDTVQSCATNTPLENESVNCIMFDPPFVISKGDSLKEKKEGQNIIHNRFHSFENPTELFGFYNNVLKESFRILKQDGVLVFKCQDTVSSAKNYLSHNIIIQQALNLGFYPKDLFILMAKQRLISGKVKNQQHARKFHSYFLVFEKKKSKIDYNFFINNF